eukprot:PhF_6_TR21908/c0_g1_i1/m.31116
MQHWRNIVWRDGKEMSSLFNYSTCGGFLLVSAAAVVSARRARYSMYLMKLREMFKADTLPLDKIGGEIHKLGSEGYVYHTMLSHSPKQSPQHVIVKYISRCAKSELQSFCHEVRVLKLLQAPGIPRFRGVVFEVGPHTRPGIVYDYISGTSLESYIRNNKFDTYTMVSILLQVALTLQALHQKKVCHRDIKTANIIVEPVPDSHEVRAYIIDFGSAVCSPTDVLNLSCGGTPGFVAPEILRGLSYGSKADVYSFGMVMYQCFVGRHPLADREDNNNADEAVAFGAVPDIPADCVVPKQLLSLMVECWNSNPAERPSAEKIVQKLTKLRNNLGMNDFL